VSEGGGTFTNGSGLAQWLRSDPVVLLTANTNWPSIETHSLWTEFVRAFDAPRDRTWKRIEGTAQVSWLKGKSPSLGIPLRIGTSAGYEDIVFSADYEQLGKLYAPVRPHKNGILTAIVSDKPNTIAWRYVGPDD